MSISTNPYAGLPPVSLLQTLASKDKLNHLFTDPAQAMPKVKMNPYREGRGEFTSSDDKVKDTAYRIIYSNARLPANPYRDQLSLHICNVLMENRDLPLFVSQCQTIFMKSATSFREADFVNIPAPRQVPAELHPYIRPDGELADHIKLLERMSITKSPPTKKFDYIATWANAQIQRLLPIGKYAFFTEARMRPITKPSCIQGDPALYHVLTLIWSNVRLPKDYQRDQCATWLCDVAEPYVTGEYAAFIAEARSILNSKPGLPPVGLQWKWGDEYMVLRSLAKVEVADDREKSLPRTRRLAHEALGKLSDPRFVCVEALPLPHDMREPWREVIQSIRDNQFSQELLQKAQNLPVESMLVGRFTNPLKNRKEEYRLSGMLACKQRILIAHIMDKVNGPLPVLQGLLMLPLYEETCDKGLPVVSSFDEGIELLASLYHVDTKTQQDRLLSYRIVQHFARALGTFPSYQENAIADLFTKSLHPYVYLRYAYLLQQSKLYADKGDALVAMRNFFVADLSGDVFIGGEYLKAVEGRIRVLQSLSIVGFNRFQELFSKPISNAEIDQFFDKCTSIQKEFPKILPDSKLCGAFLRKVAPRDFERWEEMRIGDFLLAAEIIFEQEKLVGHMNDCLRDLRSELPPEHHDFPIDDWEGFIRQYIQIMSV
jgi:hypothetical protein